MFSSCNVGGMDYLKRKEMQQRFEALQIHAVAFDFDGVLADSVAIKDTEQVFKKAVAVPWIPGAVEYLKEWPLIPSYVVSALPEEEVLKILKRCDMSRYFRAVHGAPKKREDSLGLLIKREECEPRELLFIGDSLSDHSAAEATGASFLGVVTTGITDPFPESTHTVENLLDLKKIIASWWDRESA
jgi:phosphoglycolate phosphatase